MISEEIDELIGTGNHSAKYLVAIDPLDGSSNIEVNVSIETIFSIFKRKYSPGCPPSMTDELQTVVMQIASTFFMDLRQFLFSLGDMVSTDSLMNPP